MAVKLHAKGDSIDYTPSGAVAAGDVVVQSGILGVAPLAIASATLGSLTIEGLVNTPKKSGVAFAAGAVAYWRPASACITAASAASTTRMGRVIQAYGSAATSAIVKLSPY